MEERPYLIAPPPSPAPTNYNAYGYPRDTYGPVELSATEPFDTYSYNPAEIPATNSYGPWENTAQDEAFALQEKASLWKTIRQTTTLTLGKLRKRINPGRYRYLDHPDFAPGEPRYPAPTVVPEQYSGLNLDSNVDKRSADTWSPYSPYRPPPPMASGYADYEGRGWGAVQLRYPTPPPTSLPRALPSTPQPTEVWNPPRTSTAPLSPQEAEQDTALFRYPTPSIISLPRTPNNTPEPIGKQRRPPPPPPPVKTTPFSPQGGDQDVISFRYPTPSLRSLPRTPTTTPEPTPEPKTEFSIPTPARTAALSPQEISALIDSYRLNTVFLETGSTKHLLKDCDDGSEQIWQFGETIGFGGCGQVWMERCGAKVRAVKMVSKVMPVDYKRELYAMAVFQKYKDYFVQFHGWFDDTRNIYIAMEFCSQDLSAYLRSNNHSIPFSTSIEILNSIVTALRIMQSHGFVHRDLKPQNIFIVASATSPAGIECKLGDFGLSKHLHKDTALRTVAYTPDYAAPELRAEELGLPEIRRNGDGSYTDSVDMWSIGVIAYELFTGSVPFNTAMLVYYVAGRAAFPVEALEEKVDRELVGMVMGLLKVKPEERMGVGECYGILERWMARR